MMDVTKYSVGYYNPPKCEYRWVHKDHIEKAPAWCSVDLRDGNQSLIVPMSLEEKLEFFDLLVKIGFKEIEVGFPAASETEYEFLRTLIEQNRIPADVTVQVLTQCRDHIIRKTFDAVKGAPSAVIHFYNSTSVAQREQVFKKSKEEIKKIATDGAALVKKLAEEYEGTSYNFSLRETRTSEVIEDVRDFRSDLGVLYLSTFNESVIGHALSDANLSFNLLFTAQPHVFVSDKHPLASRTEVTVEDLEDYPRYAFEQGANNSFFYSEEPLAELPHTKCISVSDRGTLSNLLAHHDGYTISTGVLSSEMYTGIASVPLQTKELMRVGYIVHNERQLSPLAASYIEKLSLFVEGYQIGLAGL